MKPITDKAEVSLDFPDKAYMGSFGRDAGYEVRADADEVLLKLVRDGDERRELALHLHYYLLSDLLTEMAAALADAPPLDEAHRQPLEASAKALAASVKRRPKKSGARAKA